MAAKQVTGIVLKLKNVRLSFPTLEKPETPKGYENSEPKYSSTLLLDPSIKEQKDQIVMVNNEIKRLIKEAWGEKPPKMKPIDCFGKGEKQVSLQTNEVYDGYQGMFFVSASNKKRPLLLSRTKDILSPEEGGHIFYGGCFVDCNINMWVQDNQYGQAIRCSLRGIRFRADGEEFGAGSASADEFEDDELEDGEMDLGLDEDEFGEL